MAEIKFKIYDKNRKRLISGTGYSITGDEEITGIVILDECQWWIENKEEQRAVPLFSETAEDKIIGNVYEKEYFV